MEKKTLRSSIIMWGVLLIGMFWLAAKLAMSYEPGIDIAQFTQSFEKNAFNVFYFKTTSSTSAFIIAAFVVWVLLLASYLFRWGQYMHGKEHGSAGFGNIKDLAKKYKQEQNVILSQNIEMGLNMYKHQHNLNTLIIGGPGSGKTRYWSWPNLLNGNTSYVCTDPKGETLRNIGQALVDMGYTVRVLNLIDMANSNRYNPFDYLRKDEDVISLIQNFIKNTTPSGSQYSDPFWGATRSLVKS